MHPMCSRTCELVEPVAPYPKTSTEELNQCGCHKRCPRDDTKWRSAFSRAPKTDQHCTLLFLSALSQPTCALKIEDKALVRRRWRAAGGPSECHTSWDRTSKRKTEELGLRDCRERGFLPSGFCAGCILPEWSSRCEPKMRSEWWLMAK